MKKLALFILAASLAVAQSVNVQKTSGTNALTGSLVVGDGKTLTATGTGTIVATSAASVSGNVTVGAGSTLTLNGVMTGTPTGGTLSLANLTLSLGTPASATLTNATGLPIATGVSGLGSGVATFLATPTSANLATAITNETGSGSLVFATSPTLTTPTLGAATATSIQAATSAGLLLNNNSGTTVITVGPGSGTGVAFNASGLTSVNSVTAAASTDLTLTGGSSGASLVLGQGTSAGNVTATITGTGSFRTSLATTKATFSEQFSNFAYLHLLASATPLSTTNYTIASNGSELFVGAPAGNINFTSAGTQYARLTSTGNLLIGTTTDMASTAGGLTVASSGAGVSQKVSNSTATGYPAIVFFDSSAAQVGSIGTANSASASISLRGKMFLDASTGKDIVLSENGTPKVTLAATTGDVSFASSSTATAVNTGGLKSANFGLSTVSGGASYFGGTTSASSSTVGAVLIGNGTAATNVAIGGGNINAGGTITAASVVYSSTTASGSAVNTAFSLRNGAGGAPNNILPSLVWDSSTLNWARIDALRNAGGGFGGTLRFWTMNGAGAEASRMTIGEGAGDVAFSSTTASTGVGTGALQVAGGIYAGAASLFAETITSNKTTVGGSVPSVGFYVSSSDPRTGLNNSSAAVDNRLWHQRVDGSGNFTITPVNDANTAGTPAVTFARSGSAPTTATFAGAVSVSGTTATWTSGTGSPESVKTAPVGSLYTRTDGGASTTLYVKESGSGNTGWVAK